MKSISAVFEATFSYLSIMAILWHFCEFRIFAFGYKAQNENMKIAENFYFWIYNVQMHVNFFSIQISTL